MPPPKKLRRPGVKTLAHAHRRVHFIQQPAGRSGRVVRIKPETPPK